MVRQNPHYPVNTLSVEENLNKRMKFPLLFFCEPIPPPPFHTILCSDMSYVSLTNKDVPPATGDMNPLAPQMGALFFPRLSWQRPQLHVFTVGFSSTKSVVACSRNVSDKLRRYS